MGWIPEPGLTVSDHASVNHAGIPGVGGGGGIFEGRPKSATNEFYVLPGHTILGKGTTTFTTTGRRYVPIVLQGSVRVDALVGEVTGGAAAGRAFRVGLYEADFDLQPGALLAEGEWDCSTTGLKSVTVDKVLTVGRYLIAQQPNNTSIQIRVVRLQSANLVMAGTDNNVTGLGVDVAYGPMDDPGVKWDIVFASSNTIPAGAWLSVSEP